MEGDSLSFLGRKAGPEFDVRTLSIAPGADRAFDEDEWRDAIVVVERGEIELECVEGGRHRFGRGDVLFLVGLPLCAIHNPGTAPALLAAAARRPAPARLRQAARA